MKSFILALFLAIVIVSDANAQSTLALQEKCAEGAKKFVSEIQVKFACEYHYNRKLDQCFVKIIYLEKGASVTLVNVFENKLIGQFYSEDPKSIPIICSVGSKKCNSRVEFEALIKPYMED